MIKTVKKVNNLKVIVFAVTFLICLPTLLSQQNDWWEKDIRHTFQFVKHPDSKGGFDTPIYSEWNQQYEVVTLNDTTLIAPIQSITLGSSEPARVIASVDIERSELEWYVDNVPINIRLNFEEDTINLTLPEFKETTLLELRYRKKTHAILKIVVFKRIVEHIVIVSTKSTIELGEFQNELNKVYGQAGMDVFISNSVYFKDTLFPDDKVFSNPNKDHLIYTQEMRSLRDRFFQTYPGADKNAYYIFLINSFKDSTLTAYGAANKAMIFATSDAMISSPNMIIRELSRGIGILEDSWLHNGPKKGTTQNLMDIGDGLQLTSVQWLRLRHSSRSFSFYDSDEDLLTNNGMVAYYLWKEDQNGNIIIDDRSPLKSILRPFKKNYYSYHLDIQDELFHTAVSFWNLTINYWHLILWSAVTLTLIVFRSRQVRHFKRDPTTRIKKNLKAAVLFSFFAGLYIFVYHLVNFELSMFQVYGGHIKELDKMSPDEVRSSILYNNILRTKNQKELRSEILVERNGKWILKKRKPVLYFDAYYSLDSLYRIKFTNSSDSIIIPEENMYYAASSHYLIIRKHMGDSISSELYNHLGIPLKEKIHGEDPAKRILLFVNGYRPTSIGHNFQENFDDVLNRGLEYPQTSNMIYNFDRYDYWQPWQAIDDKLKQRINPQETFYADGHFSVSSSNYRTLFNFTKTAASYPKRCPDPKHHTCGELKISTQTLYGNGPSKTITLLPIRPNKRGFRERAKNGEIAGKNLISILNELPGHSLNDTIYIVAHSMGFAYATGIIESIRGNVNFGGLIIIAPENGMSGKVNPNEWQYVWQYGSKYNEKIPACLQDGIAPQTKVGGLTEENRCYFPRSDMWYNKQGFFNAHFIGYYTWILDIPATKGGHIPQR